MIDKPKIITMCGSSRFVDFMAVCAWLLEKHEQVITMGLHLLPRWYTNAEDHLGEAEGVAEQFDALHLKKIEMSDQIFVVNVGGYIGDSTTREIEHAQNRGFATEDIRWFITDYIGTQCSKALNDWVLRNSRDP